jgi:hypothetical protein
MKHIKIAVLVGLIAMQGLLIGCSPSKINSSPTSSGGIVIGAGSASALALTANPTTISPSGSSIITAHVVDTLGNDVPDGTAVAFAFAPGDQVKASLSSGFAQTVSGLAMVTVTATTFSNTVVTINAASGSASASIAITITVGAASGTVAVTATPPTITAGNTTNITATVKDSNGNLIINALVNFSLNNNNLASLSQSSATTNASGVATTVLSGNAAGSVTVTATVPSLGGTSGQANVTISPVALVPTLSVTSNASSILTGGTTTITALLSGFNPVSSLNVNFTVSNPAAAYLQSAPTVTGSSLVVATDASGVATIAFNANNIATPVTITASYATLNLTGTTTITISAPPPDNVNLVAKQASITVYGTTPLSATVKGNGQPVPDGTLVNFIISDGTYGSISNALGSTVGGVATTTFSAVGKSGSVTISATAGTVSATTTVNIQPATTGSIQFVSAVPQVVGLVGSGQPATSTVTFAAKDVNGNPVSDGISVNFTMNGPGGGSYIGSTIGSQVATASTISGEASVILHGGSTAGPVTIIASIDVSPAGVTPVVTISTSADQISIGGGVPSAAHFNLATSQFNLPGLVVSDATANTSAYIADRFGNYNVLNGTSISFYTEAGAIDRQGITDATGMTSVNFRTQAPDPALVRIWGPTDPRDETALIDYLNSIYGLGIPVGNAIHPRNGWVTVLATVQGEESFLDENADGLFTRSYSNTACPGGYTCECDNGVPNTYAGCITSQPNGPSVCSSASTCATAGGSIPASSMRSEGFLDLGEPFIDVNDDGCRNDGATKNCGGNISPSTDPFELFIDANLNGKYDPPNGIWDGPSCQTAGCQTTKMIWTSEKLVFTGNAKYCAFGPVPLGNVPYGSSRSYSFMVGDMFTNNLVPGTVVAASTNAGTLSGQTSYPVPDGVPFGPTEIFFILTAPTAPACSGTPCVVPTTSFTITGTASNTAVLGSTVVGCTITTSGIFF